jgi:hypothetical protein
MKQQITGQIAGLDVLNLDDGIVVNENTGQNTGHGVLYSYDEVEANDKGLVVLYVDNGTTEIADKGHDKGQSVPYNTRTVIDAESRQGAQYGNEVENRDAISSRETTRQLSDKIIELRSNHEHK